MIDAERLLRQAKRDRQARLESEMIAETKLLELYFANKKFQDLVETLSDKDKKTQAILTAIADAVIVTDEKDKIIMCNRGVKKLLHHNQVDLRGKTFFSLLNLDKKELAIKKKTGTSYFDTVFLRQDNKELPLEIAYAQTTLKDGTHTVYALRDISERKQLENRIYTAYEITSVLSQTETLEEATPKILKLICENLNLELGGLWKIDRSTNTLKCLSIWHRDEISLKEFENYSFTVAYKKGVGLPGRVWSQEKPCWISNLIRDPNFPRSPYAAQAGLHNGFGFPIWFEGEIVGVIEFFSRSKENLNKNLLIMLENVTRQIGFFLERKSSQKRVTDLNKQLMYAARTAGMAEVATSVLHNIGNVLNSINVTASLFKERLLKSEMSGLEDLSNLFQEKEMSSLLTQHPRGKHITEYVALLASYWREEQKDLLEETEKLLVHIQHIKEIVMMQQSMSGVLGIIEKVSIASLLEDAMAIVSASLERWNVTVKHEYSHIEPILVDRVKLLQILVNLIRNALDSLLSSNTPTKTIILKTRLGNDKVYIDVIDNGVGILPEDINKIFSYGFTTKKEGHGFGLHISALSAKEMGGQIVASSQGIGLGATFTVELPIKSEMTRVET